MKERFKKCLEQHDINGIKEINKSDLHNHFGKGGRLEYLMKQHDVTVQRPPLKFDSLGHMDTWFYEHVKFKFNYLQRVQAAFAHANDDHITVLSASFGPDKDMSAFISLMEKYNKNYAPNTVLLPELALDRDCDVDETYEMLDEILSYKWYKSIDIIGGEFDQPIENFKKIYRKDRYS